MPPQDTATLLIISLPPGALCGIDLLSFTTSLRFHGIKNLTPSIHFLYTASTPSFSTRHGIWLLPGPGAVITKIWDPKREELVPVIDSTERKTWEARIPQLWEAGLTPYRPSADESEGEGVWDELVDCITPSLLSRITGGETNNWVFSTGSSMEGDMEAIPGLSGNFAAAEDEEKELGFLPIDLKKTWREGAIGRERTDAVRDRSWALGDLMERYCGGREDEVIGEMQASFIGGLVLGNYSCGEQWKRVLALVLTCRKATEERSGFFVKVLRALRAQLGRRGEAEGGVFDFVGEDGIWLVRLLRGFRRGLEDMEGVTEVRREFEVLVEFVRREFGWELNDEFLRRGMVELEDGEQVEMEMDDLEGEDERGEYAPLVVDLGEGDGDTVSPPERLRQQGNETPVSP